MSGPHFVPYRVFVVDDSTTARMGARAILNAIPEFQYVGEAASGAEALRTIGEARAQVVLMDVSMPGASGIDTTKRVIAAHPELKIVAWTTSVDSDDLVEMLQAGCCGYTLKDLGPSELRKALLVAIQGDMPIPRQLIPAVVRRAAAGIPARPHPEIRLTIRERQVLEFLVQGKIGKEIATSLGISAKSVESHSTSLYAKLGVKNRSQAAAHALRLGLIPMLQGYDAERR